jgi:hypothetical protein
MEVNKTLMEDRIQILSSEYKNNIQIEESENDVNLHTETFELSQSITN